MFMKKQLEILDYKENYYEELIRYNSNDKFNPANNLETAVG